MFGEYTRLRIVALAAEGYRAPTITKKLADENLKASRQGISKFLKKYKSTGSIYHAGGNGRKPKLTSNIRDFIDKRMEEDDETTLKELQQKLQGEIGQKLCRMTILKCRSELGWSHRGAAYCQTQREANKLKRLDWAKKNIEDSFEDCIYSDETTVQLENHRRFCCSKTGQKPRYKPRPKHPVKVHVWAAISKKGRSGICIFDGCMDAPTYVNILEKTLLPMIKELFPDGHRFIQDNDPKITSAFARKFYVERGINWWPTPAESPDANPIENMWHELKEYIRRVVKPRTKEELVQGIVAFGILLTKPSAQDTLIILRKYYQK